MLENLSRIVLITGHYGSGKTNLAVNLALDLKAQGRKVVLCDLDIVNPYFRSADFGALMRRRGIETISPTFANTNLDIPALGPGISAAIGREDTTVIADVGGDDAGAVALGRYAPEMAKRPYTMLYVYNYYRYLTREPDDALDILRDIAAVSRLSATHLVNNPNLSDETGEEEIRAAQPACDTLSALSGLPVLFTCVPRALAGRFPAGDGYYPVDIYVKKPWEEPGHPYSANTLR